MLKNKNKKPPAPSLEQAAQTTIPLYNLELPQFGLRNLGHDFIYCIGVLPIRQQVITQIVQAGQKQASLSRGQIHIKFRIAHIAVLLAIYYN